MIGPSQDIPRTPSPSPSFQGKRNLIRTYGKWLSIVAGTFLLIGLVFVMSVYWGAFGKIPNKEILQNIKTEEASIVYGSDGKILGKYFIKNRTQAEFDIVPDFLHQALIATEDRRFYDHAGVDYLSMPRVLTRSILMGDRSSGGGSTISQQLAKNLYPRGDHGILSFPVNKLKEMFIATRLEKIYTKQQILALYLNTVSFGEGAYGIEVASRRFFNRRPEELRIEQAAMLVGMLKATTTYNPQRNKERAKVRRDVVIGQMERYGTLNKSHADSLRALPLGTDYQYISHNEGPAPYFRERLRQELQSSIKNIKKPNGQGYNLYTDGLKIYTTIDSRLQAHAEQAVVTQMIPLQKRFNTQWKKKYKKLERSEVIQQGITKSPRYKKLRKKGLPASEIEKIFRTPIPMRVYTVEGEVEMEMSPLDSVMHYTHILHTGLFAMDPSTGHVLAWVGGVNHKYFQYDHVQSQRQVGSTFKPIVYAAALERGIRPCEYISNEERVFEDYEDWTPRNSDNVYGGEYSMQGGLTKSVNVVAVNLLMETEVGNVVRLGEKLGIESELPPVPSLALGTADISLFEMVPAYAGLTNGGMAVEPVYLLRVEDENGQILYQAEKQSPTRVITKGTSNLITHMMRGVVNQGTAAGLRSRYKIRSDIAGKTGTTQDQADGWFIGAAPNLVAGAWIGAEDRRIHFQSLSDGQGARTAMPVYADFMKRVYTDPSFRHLRNDKFPPLSYDLVMELDCQPFREDLPGMWDFKRKWQQRKWERERKRQEDDLRRRRLFPRLFKKQ